MAITTIMMGAVHVHICCDAVVVDSIVRTQVTQRFGKNFMADGYNEEGEKVALLNYTAAYGRVGAELTITEKHNAWMRRLGYAKKYPQCLEQE